ncbi:MAG: MucB/RseB C-terminal domain-containing protein, partial [Pseudomonas sp.]|nr:MucB/RseB C-terminal domain-containing protein [Pseudomonas sp.]
LTPLSEQALRPGVSCLPIKSAVTSLTTANHWHAGWLPPGFNLLAAREQAEPASTVVLTWLMFGDGLARFSVFIEPLQGESVVNTRSQLGPTAVVSKRMPTAAGEFMVTVVGEIPPGTAERVALAMGPAQESTP